MTWLIEEDFLALKAMLLEDELSYDSSIDEETKTFWDNLDADNSRASTSLDQSKFPLVFSVALPGARLAVEIKHTESLPVCSVTSESRNIQTRLTEELAELMKEISHEDLPMLYLYTSLQSIVQTSDAFQTAVLSDKEQTQDQAAQEEAKSTISTGKRLQCKSALLWAHHLLANSKRKDIQHWSTELKVWAIAKIGYPGVMVFQGIAEDVDEFIRRIKALQWFALQVRYEEAVEAEHGVSESELLSSCGLAKACQPLEEKRAKPFAVEVESMSALSSLMTASEMRPAFAASMKLPG